jgi:hypothetical protein
MHVKKDSMHLRSRHTVGSSPRQRLSMELCTYKFPFAVHERSFRQPFYSVAFIPLSVKHERN